MTSINSLPMKSRRAQRRRSHIARDLRTPKYGVRKVEDKKKLKDVRSMTHRELVEAINECNFEYNNDSNIALGSYQDAFSPKETKNNV